MYIGVDYSSRKVSAARLSEDGRLLWLFSYRVPKGSADALENLNLIASAYAQSRSINVNYTDYNYVSIEAPIVGNSGAARTAVQMAMVAGALARFETNMLSAVRLVPPATWKKQVCGKGNLKKDEVAEWLKNEHHDLWKQTKDDDEVDAVCLAICTMAARLVVV